MLRIGIIGMSPGNAHPYSWSAIINGIFDAEEIDRMGFPLVSEYLRANKDTLGIDGARVTACWTQDSEITSSIAHSTGIEHCCNTLDEMTGLVDAVILARDDAAAHVGMAKPFIDAGIPIFIDKPLAANIEDLEYFSRQSQAGKFIMSCSSMRYSCEMRTAKQELFQLGNLELATCVGKKDWMKYGVHIMEALFSLLNDPVPESVQYVGKENRDIVILQFTNGFIATLHLFMDISSTFQLTVFGQNGYRLVDVRNSYSMFRNTILEFIHSVNVGKSRLEFDKTERIIKTLIAADQSRLAGGKVIQL